ncbi:MAG TPA: hypothetical protein VLI06_01000 [Solimonas sp.]|nr:hypothetical protein [Solimonas sp.]
MTTNTAVQAALVILALAAMGGLLMAGMRFSGRPQPPAGLAMLHGLGAGAALTLLIYAHLTVGLGPLEMAGVALLILAAAVGIALNLRFHARGLALPIPVVLGHAVTAAAGFSLLLVGAMTGA